MECLIDGTYAVGVECLIDGTHGVGVVECPIDVAYGRGGDHFYRRV